MDSWLYIWWTRRAPDSPSISSPNDFCDRPPTELSRSNRRSPLSIYDRRCSLSPRPWIRGKLAWMHKTVCNRCNGARKTWSEWSMKDTRVVFGVFIFGSFFFFFFLPFSRDVLFRLTRVESSTMTRLKEREGGEGEQRVIINTWKIAVVILETGEMDYWCDVLFRSTRDDVFPDSIKGSTMYHHCWYNEKRTVLMLLLFLQRSKKTVGLFRPR